MILPTKHIAQNEALLGVGATILARLTAPRTVSSLWDELRTEPNVGTFERFVLPRVFPPPSPDLDDDWGGAFEGGEP
jgi:hypothetical protein